MYSIRPNILRSNTRENNPIVIDVAKTKVIALEKPIYIKGFFSQKLDPAARRNNYKCYDIDGKHNYSDDIFGSLSNSFGFFFKTNNKININIYTNNKKLAHRESVGFNDTSIDGQEILVDFTRTLGYYINIFNDERGNRYLKEKSKKYYESYTCLPYRDYCANKNIWSRSLSDSTKSLLIPDEDSKWKP